MGARISTTSENVGQKVVLIGPLVSKNTRKCLKKFIKFSVKFIKFLETLLDNQIESFALLRACGFIDLLNRCDFVTHRPVLELHFL